MSVMYHKISRSWIAEVIGNSQCKQESTLKMFGDDRRHSNWI